MLCNPQASGGNGGPSERPKVQSDIVAQEKSRKWTLYDCSVWTIADICKCSNSITRSPCVVAVYCVCVCVCVMEQASRWSTVRRTEAGSPSPAGNGPTSRRVSTNRCQTWPIYRFYTVTQKKRNQFSFVSLAPICQKLAGEFFSHTLRKV